jgi:hypothetical protein
MKNSNRHYRDGTCANCGQQHPFPLSEEIDGLGPNCIRSEGVEISEESVKKFMDALRQPRPPRRVMPAEQRAQEVKAAFNRLAILLHPDKPTGSVEAMQDLNTLMAAAKAERGLR